MCLIHLFLNFYLLVLFGVIGCILRIVFPFVGFVVLDCRTFLTTTKSPINSYVSSNQNHTKYPYTSTYTNQHPPTTTLISSLHQLL